MSESNGNAGSSNPTPSKAIASLAKKQGDVTRMGAQKLKFVPTLPARRKKEEVKEEAPSATPSSSERGRGRGRGDARGRGRGRGGEGRGAAPRPPPVEMTASGPFAMGPALAGTSARRTAPRSNFAPVIPQGPGASSRLGAGLTQTTAPSLGVKRELNDLGVSGQSKGKKVDEDEGEVYSDPDEGVEIVDMENVRTMDWMAPESLRKDKESRKKKVKKEEKINVDPKGKGVDMSGTTSGTSVEPEELGNVNLANALHLSDSEDEEELEDIIDDFALAMDMGVDEDVRQERLYFFQFPSPLPTFYSSSPRPEAEHEINATEPEASGTSKVRFAEDTKPAAPGAPQVKQEESAADAKVDGVIGQLEVYKSGAVKMRLGNGIVMDVTAATQPSFLQHAVYLDPENKRLCVLGEVNRRFVVSPDIETLLASMEAADHPAPPELEIDGLISMDTT